MRRFVFLTLATALVVFTALAAPAGRTRAAALNESDTPAEADYCLLEFIDTEVIGPGEVFGVYGQVFETGITEAVGDSGAIIAEAGIGPLGTDPRFDAGWTFTSASFNQELSSIDQYFAVVTAPLPATTTDYSVTFRFSFDGVDHTYCDSDGAGSNAGVDYDAALNGAITVNGTGATGSSEGSVNTSVDVIADPGACIILNTDTVNYGQLPFSTPGQPQSGGGLVTITSCSLTTPLDLLAKGTDASGPSANWQLTTPPGSSNMCDSGSGGIDEYGQRLVHGETLESLDLTLSNQTYTTGLGTGQSLDTGVDILMPCVGSTGTGETVSSSVTFTAVAGSTPDVNPCAGDIPFVNTGLTSWDNTNCQSQPNEILGSCWTTLAGRSQYLAFELQPGETGTASISSVWDAAVALLEVGDQSVLEVDCSDDFFGGQNPEVVTATNNNGVPRFYIVEVDGGSPMDFGSYDVNLVITP